MTVFIEDGLEITVEAVHQDLVPVRVSLIGCSICTSDKRHDRGPIEQVAQAGRSIKGGRPDSRLGRRGLLGTTSYGTQRAYSWTCCCHKREHFSEVFGWIPHKPRIWITRPLNMINQTRLGVSFRPGLIRHERIPATLRRCPAIQEKWCYTIPAPSYPFSTRLGTDPRLFHGLDHPGFDPRKILVTIQWQRLAGLSGNCQRVT